MPEFSLVMEHGRSAADFDDLSRQVPQLTALVTEQQATWLRNRPPSPRSTKPCRPPRNN